MTDSEDQMTLEQICEDRGIKYQDVLDLLDLYDSEAPEEEILRRIDTYPVEARALVSSLILPPFG